MSELEIAWFLIGFAAGVSVVGLAVVLFVLGLLLSTRAIARRAGWSGDFLGDDYI